MTKQTQIFFGLTRLGLGWIFLWAFLDKVFGLGFATEAGKAWIDGASPTYGYLMFGTRGPLAPLFQSLAGHTVIDILFMGGLLFVGVTLMLGIMTRLGSAVAVIMLLLIYVSSALPPEHNPLLDEHIIYALTLIGLATLPAGEWLGLGKQWQQLAFVRRHPILS